ncbi:hypothetical protein N7G274_006544 [Stereocaulon virgatum]|uniref:NmrA-like domain-containing protein n=1 Tax=Stereocaulon virgatum TaxID=373712 RepID=A0ABR4A3Y0_9LECA
MAQQYASEQPQGLKNHIEKVAIVGAGGTIGKVITEQLLNLGKHTITALTRADSPNKLPPGIEIKIIDYAYQASLVSALQGQDALIITMGTRAPPEHQTKLIEAAATANVPWVLPNEWGYDNSNPNLREYNSLVRDKKAAYRAHIEELAKSSWIGVTCGFWYEFSLSFGPSTYGFDFANRTVTFFDDGNTRINTSTWIQCGRCVAQLLALKILPDDADDQSPCLARYRNQCVYVSSFNLSQRDMLGSIMRVTGTTLDDWKIVFEASTSRYETGLEAMQKGDMMGFVRMMYTRNFFPDGCGEFEKTRGLLNGVLGLPREDLDACTRAAVEMAKVPKVS